MAVQNASWTAMCSCKYPCTLALLRYSPCHTARMLNSGTRPVSHRLAKLYEAEQVGERPSPSSIERMRHKCTSRNSTLLSFRVYGHERHCLSEARLRTAVVRIDAGAMLPQISARPRIRRGRVVDQTMETSKLYLQACWRPAAPRTWTALTFSSSMASW